MKLIFCVVAAFFAIPVAIGIAISAAGSSNGGQPGAATLAQIPAGILQDYLAASATCSGLEWEVLAAVGTLESSNGTSTAPGVTSGLNSAGLAAGPMQFEPATFAQYDQPVPADPTATPVPPGVNPPDIYDPADSVYAAARYLCSLGAGDPSQLSAALLTYNGGSQAYVDNALKLIAQYRADAAATTGGAGAGAGIIPNNPPSASAGYAVQFALAALGVPYVWRQRSKQRWFGRF